jgi:hypothetical protein
MVNIYIYKMHSFHIKPPFDLVYKIVSTFIPTPHMTRLQEIHSYDLNKPMVIRQMSNLYPELVKCYRSCKLEELVHEDKIENTLFTFNSCIRILRQTLRASGYKVNTKRIRGHKQVLVIIPPLIRSI